MNIDICKKVFLALFVCFNMSCVKRSLYENLLEENEILRSKVYKLERQYITNSECLVKIRTANNSLDICTDEVQTLNKEINKLAEDLSWCNESLAIERTRNR